MIFALKVYNSRARASHVSLLGGNQSTFQGLQDVSYAVS